jgi:hypothetical protein
MRYGSSTRWTPALLLTAPKGAVCKIVWGVISPLLANIYLNELDRFVEDTLVATYTVGKTRKANPEYTRVCHSIRDARGRGDLEEVKRLQRQRRTMPAMAPVDAGYRRLRYVRYADDFLLGFVGPKKEAEEIRRHLGEFLSQELQLTLSKDKTFITHAGDDKAKFLGYELSATRVETLISQDGRRATNGIIHLRMPREVVQKYQQRFSRRGKVTHRADLLSDTDYTIVQRYQAVLKGLYNYYCMAVNVARRMGRVKWILQTSLTKTLASKFKCKVRKIYKKYQVVFLGRKELRVTIKWPDKEPLIAVFGGFPLERIPEGMGPVVFSFGSAWFSPSGNRSEVVQRLLAERCELCGKEGVPIEMHHIRKLADIDRPGRRPKENWERIMSARKRKTLAVCGECHDEIHAGRYNGPKLTG